MKTRDLLVRSLAVVDKYGYVTKDYALIHDVKSTATRVLESFKEDDIEAFRMIKAERLATDIIMWLKDAPVASNNYLTKCKALVLSETCDLATSVGYLCSLGKAYSEHLKSIIGLEKVTKIKEFAGTHGRSYTGKGEVINVIDWNAFKKVMVVDSNGFLISYIASKKNKNTLTIPKIGSKVNVLGTVKRCQLSTPFETGITNVKIEKI